MPTELKAECLKLERPPRLPRSHYRLHCTAAVSCATRDDCTSQSGHPYDSQSRAFDACCVSAAVVAATGRLASSTDFFTAFPTAVDSKADCRADACRRGHRHRSSVAIVIHPAVIAWHSLASSRHTEAERKQEGRQSVRASEACRRQEERQSKQAGCWEAHTRAGAL